ncbi:MAG: hypothetical protein H6579_10845 [Chitinophagales bacterium]|nr:hypothetical protein [Chitinophagales bacterium]
MQKVLIISYFFPPCNLTAANRIGSWQQYLPSQGFYPIILTRNWTGKELTEEDRLLSSGNTLRLVQNENSEIHYLPYKSSLRDRFFIKGKSNKLFAILSKVLTLYHLIFQNFSVKAIPYYNIYFHAKDLLKKDESVTKVIISGNLFEQFYFGYLLKKAFPRIEWIADYRDEWTSHHLYNSFTSKNEVIKKLERSSELKWVKSAKHVQTVCPYFAKRLETLHQRRVHVVPNGFGENFEKYLSQDPKSPKVNGPLKLLFSGTLYENQILDVFLNSIKSFDAKELQVSFIGSKFSLKQEQVLKELPLGLVQREAWLDKNEVLKRMEETDIFLMFPFQGMKGWPSSKLYDYLPFQKPILLCPSDKDIIEDILLDTGLGIVKNGERELQECLKDLIAKKEKEQAFLSLISKDKIEKYSRRNSINALIRVLNS